ncbi:hypothetical protein BJX99DRAFT_231883 [Aspergillus californicus]
MPLTLFRSSTSYLWMIASPDTYCTDCPWYAQEVSLHREERPHIPAPDSILRTLLDSCACLQVRPSTATADLLHDDRVVTWRISPPASSMALPSMHTTISHATMVQNRYRMVPTAAVSGRFACSLLLDPTLRCTITQQINHGDRFAGLC